MYVLVCFGHKSMWLWLASQLSIFATGSERGQKRCQNEARTRPENSFGNPSALAAQQHFARCPWWLQAASVDCAHGPSFLPSFLPSFFPSFLPFVPPLHPSLLPSLPPSLLSSFPPSLLPSFPPFLLPSFPPSLLPSFLPFVLPSFPPSLLPSLFPSLLPSFLPACLSACLPSLPPFPPSLLPSFPPSLLSLLSSFPPPPSLLPSFLSSFPPFLLPSFLHGHYFFWCIYIFLMHLYFFDAFLFVLMLLPRLYVSTKFLVFQLFNIVFGCFWGVAYKYPTNISEPKPKSVIFGASKQPFLPSLHCRSVMCRARQKRSMATKRSFCSSPFSPVSPTFARSGKIQDGAL